MKIIERDGKCRIYYSYKGKVVRFSTGVNYNDRNTIVGKQIVQSKIARLEDIINQHIIKTGKKPEVGYIYEQLSMVQIPLSDDLLGFYDKFLESKRQDITVKSQSEKDYVSLRNALIDYQRDHTHLYLSNIDKKFMITFTNYLSKERDPVGDYKTRGSLNDNTIRKRVQTLRTFFHWLEDNKYCELPAAVMKYNIEKFETPFVTLSDTELHSLWYDYTNPKYEKIRDILIFACMVSLRYSDIVTLTKKHIIDDTIVKVAQKSRKGKEKYVVKLNSIAKKILEKWNYNLGGYTDQYFNREVKKMAEDSGLFDYDVEFSVYKGGKEVLQKEKMYNLISAHTGRRSFITRCIDNNVPIREIMIMTSHVKIDTLMKYIDKKPKKDSNFVDQLTF
jgi:integrase